MSRIFLSHSSRNNAEAIAIRAWLTECGWDDVFLDLDPERGLKAGERWQQALKQAAERCELVIFLVSPAWVESKWCLIEFMLAKTLNKRVFSAIVETTSFADLPSEMTSEWQVTDLTIGVRDSLRSVILPNGPVASVAFASEGLKRLRIGLQHAGLDPRYFAWPPESDPKRPPYRGLKALEAADAGIFFGRDGPIVLGLDALRGLREAPAPRLLVIIGASGAGKSSFMRAGLIPRLIREDQHFLLLPTVRPQRAVLTGETGFLVCLEQAMASARLSKSRADLRAAIGDGFIGVSPVLMALQQGAQARADLCSQGRKPPTLILPIDQAEELFLTEGASEADAFLNILAGLASEDAPALIALFTIRSDHYEQLQTAKALEGFPQRTLSLLPMPKGSYADVIKGPVRRLDGTARALRIEDPLVDALLHDVELGSAKDALPLLAFTLEQLYCEYGGDGDLTLSEYEQFGRVRGSIEAAVELAFKSADRDPAVPRDRIARLALLRRGLVPWLAGIDPESGLPRRRIARISEIPAESLPLIEHLVEQRLLSTDVARDNGEKTIEPAHEALLRQWGQLQGWLTEDSGLLVVLDGVKRAARDWASNGELSAWLVHRGRQLTAAENLFKRLDLAASLDITDQRYIKQCLQRKRSAQRRSWVVAAAVLLIVAFAYLVYEETTARDALRQVARQLILDGRPIEAGPFALAAMANRNSIQALFPNAPADEVLRDTGLTLQLLFALTEPSAVMSRMLTADGRRLFVEDFENNALLFDTATGEKIAQFGNFKSWGVAEDGKLATIRYRDLHIALVDLESGNEIRTLTGAGEAKSVSHNGKSNQVAIIANDNSCKLFPKSQSGTFVKIGPSGYCSAISLKDSPPRAIVRFFDGTGAIMDESGEKLFDLKGASACKFCDVSESGTIAYALSGAHMAIIDIPSRTRRDIDASALTFENVLFSPSGTTVATRDSKGHVTLWSTRSAMKLVDIGVSPSWGYSSSGKFLMTIRDDEGGALWRADTGSQIASFGPGDIEGYKFSKNDDVVIRSHSDTITFIDRNALIRTLPRVPKVTGVTVSHDGTKIAVSSRTSPGYLWDVTKWRKITDFALNGEDNGDQGVFSRNGTRYIAHSGENAGSIWDTESGERVGRLGGPGAVWEFSMAIDASIVVTESNNSRIAVWNIEKKTGEASGAELRQQVCSTNYRFLDFTSYDKDGFPPLGRATTFLVGRPSNPCDWEGLLSRAGWRQLFNHWLARFEGLLRAKRLAP